MLVGEVLASGGGRIQILYYSKSTNKTLLKFKMLPNYKCLSNIRKMYLKYLKYSEKENVEVAATSNRLVIELITNYFDKRLIGLSHFCRRENIKIL